MFRRKTKIEQLCRQTGRWAVTAFDKQDLFTVRTTAAETIYEIILRSGKQKSDCTRFHCWLPVSFHLDNPPSGLFARLMMRSRELRWSAWVLNISNACEGDACVTVLIPNVGLDAKLFDEICREQSNEVAAFHRELRDKFHWTAQFGGSSTASGAKHVGPGVPMPRPDGLPQRYR